MTTEPIGSIGVAPEGDAAPAAAMTPRHRLFRAVFGTVRSDVGLWAGLSFIVFVLLGSVLAPTITGYAPDELVAMPLQPPSAEHLFGTDQYGRDLLVRTFVAAQVDYLIGAFVIVCCGVLGSLIGVYIASTRVRGVDWAVSRLIDAFIAFPLTVLVLALGVVIGSEFTVLGLPRGLPSVLIVYALIGWAYYARLARAQVLSLRSRDFVRAGRAMGYSDTRITLRHLFPQVAMVTFAYAIGDAIVAIALASSLAFLGAGIAPPTPEWGQIIFEGRGVLAQAWWIAAFPAIFLALSGIALVGIGAALERRAQR